jgi:beta-lactamase class A
MRLTGLLAWLLVFFVQPALAELPPLRSLEHRLAILATENPGEYGIAALDLGTGAMVTFNGDQPFPMASTMKIAVAAAYLSEVDAGRRRLDEMIAGATAAALLDAMITRSDNRATDLLLASLGGPATSIGGCVRTGSPGSGSIARSRSFSAIAGI